MVVYFIYRNKSSTRNEAYCNTCAMPFIAITYLPRNEYGHIFLSPSKFSPAFSSTTHSQNGIQLNIQSTSKAQSVASCRLITSRTEASVPHELCIKILEITQQPLEMYVFLYAVYGEQCVEIGSFIREIRTIQAFVDIETTLVCFKIKG